VISWVTLSETQVNYHRGERRGRRVSRLRKSYAHSAIESIVFLISSEELDGGTSSPVL
jgi:hypothetical protein